MRTGTRDEMPEDGRRDLIALEAARKIMMIVGRSDNLGHITPSTARMAARTQIEVRAAIDAAIGAALSSARRASELRERVVAAIAPIQIPGGLRHDEYCGWRGLRMVADAAIAALRPGDVASPEVRAVEIDPADIDDEEYELLQALIAKHAPDLHGCAAAELRDEIIDTWLPAVMRREAEWRAGHADEE